MMMTPTTRNILLGGGYPLPAIDFDFLNDRYRQDGVGESSTIGSFLSCSRASQAYADDSAGVWSSFSSNVLRRTDRGLLVEESRTNSLRNNSMQGAAAGTPGTLPTNWLILNGSGTRTQQIVGTGTVNGVEYIDIRLSGTGTGTTYRLAFEQTTQVAALNGQTWASSFFCALIAGSMTNVTSISNEVEPRDAGGVITQALQIIMNLTSTLQRFTQLRTLAAPGTTAFITNSIRINVVASAAVDVTVRIGWPQLERGDGVSSPIRTTSAAATRAADVVTVTSVPALSSALALAAEGYSTLLQTAGADQYLISASDGTTNNRFDIFRSSSGGGMCAVHVVGAAGTTLTGDATQAPDVLGKAAAAAIAGEQAVAGRAGNSGGDSTLIRGAGQGMPGGLNAIHIGSRGDGGLPWTGYLTRVRVWPTQRVSNAALRRLVAAL